jgi:hypothetical protein
VRRTNTLAVALAAVLGLSLLWSGRATAQTIRQIIGPSIKGGIGLGQPLGIAADSGGNVYVTSSFRANALQITPTGVISEIIFALGDGQGNTLDFRRWCMNRRIEALRGPGPLGTRWARISA